MQVIEGRYEDVNRTFMRISNYSESEVLGKQRGLQAPGWREAAGDYGRDGVHMSIADVTGPESLQQVRAYKKEKKAAAKAAKA